MGAASKEGGGSSKARIPERGERGDSAVFGRRLEVGRTAAGPDPKAGPKTQRWRRPRGEWKLQRPSVVTETLSASGRGGDTGGGVSGPLSTGGRGEGGPRSAGGRVGPARHLPAGPGQPPQSEA